MALDQEYQRAIAAESATPPEQRAVRQFGPLVSAFAGAENQRTLQGLQADTMRRGVEADLANARADQRNANRDAAIALGVTAGNVGLSALGAHEQAIQAHRAEMDAKYTQDLIDSLRTIIKQYPDEFELRLNGTHPTQQTQPTPESAPSPMPTYQTFGRGEVVPLSPLPLGDYHYGRGIY